MEEGRPVDDLSLPSYERVVAGKARSTSTTRSPAPHEDCLDDVSLNDDRHVVASAGDGAARGRPSVCGTPLCSLRTAASREPEIGFEPMTPCLQDRCSDQLSYSGVPAS